MGGKMFGIQLFSDPYVGAITIFDTPRPQTPPKTLYFILYTRITLEILTEEKNSMIYTFSRKYLI